MKLFLHSWIGDIQFFKAFPPIIIGNVRYKLKGHDQRKILKILKEGDILLRKYDSYLTGLLVPGNYSHVGLYVGNDTIIHSVTKYGVSEEDILTYLRADHIEILRVEKYDLDEIIKVINTAKRQLGVDYDYTFEGHDDSRFYCSELIRYCYKDYPNVNIPTDEKLSPDGLLKGKFISIFRI